MFSKDQLYVGQVFPRKEAFKFHMTLYAISNKLRYLVKKLEPRKILLECVEGASCGWRVYATKIGGFPKFEINTMENVHTCSVDDRWAFQSHATSTVIGDMMGHKYGT